MIRGEGVHDAKNASVENVQRVDPADQPVVVRRHSENKSSWMQHPEVAGGGN